MKERLTRVFVYGILKDGTGEPATVAGYDLYAFSSFPAAVWNPGAPDLHGEVRRVDDETLRYWDIVEGVDKGFYRRESTLATGRTGEIWAVQIYAMEEHLVTSVGARKISSGIWKREDAYVRDRSWYKQREKGQTSWPEDPQADAGAKS